MRTESIGTIRKRFHREWLLIAVERMNPRTAVPLTGRLLFHSPHRDDVYDDMLRRKKDLTLVVYSDDCLPPGYALAL